MPKNKRIEELERATGGRGDGPVNVVKVVEMTEDDDVISYFMVDGQRMSEHEFYRRWPNWSPTDHDVSVSWD